ncbi:sodium/potassium/calcium exchanger 1-like isoform X4 [Frieseomelitta varia]|uniref:sodium/potassium/calcium exchanger 1-like isoform X4 n=1 Tax=Frieseomelitta varia TaxID=561572 RepID=UPI001CB6A734|nr:sodium/potassium/calcium exchanger 1-like isoform X4 [Frieseomelitta varia]
MTEITDFGPRKTIFILAIVAGCFAVLWPKIFYPMLTASVNPHHTSDNSACCDVIFESDVTAADIMYEICQNILKHHQIDSRVRDALKSIKLTPQSANLCREEILARCGIDLSTFLAERERLGKSYKQVLEEIRSFNSSLCLKIHFRIPLSQLGTPHLIRNHILMPHNTIKQERSTPPHAGGLHPALRERGRTIPSSHIVPKVAERPDHVVPKMRPPLGGAGHVVPAPKGSSTMGIIMPLYTLGIVLFFLYTIVKVLRKNSDSEIISEYPGATAEKEFRRMVFSPEAFATAMTGGTMHYQKERSPSPQRPAPTIEELKDLDGPPKSKGLAEVDRSPKAEHSTTDEEVENVEHSPTVKVMGMEMTASCEGKGSRPTTPIIPILQSHIEREKTPPKPIYLEGALPPQCELLVTDSETQAQKAEEDVEAPVVLSGKMTLSLISLDQNAAEFEKEDREIQNAEDTTVSNIKDMGKLLRIADEKEEVDASKVQIDEMKKSQEVKQEQVNKEEEKHDIYLEQERFRNEQEQINEGRNKMEIDEIEKTEEDEEEVELSDDGEEEKAEEKYTEGEGEVDEEDNEKEEDDEEGNQKEDNKEEQEEDEEEVEEGEENEEEESEDEEKEDEENEEQEMTESEEEEEEKEMVGKQERNQNNRENI